MAHTHDSGLHEPLIDEDAKGFKPAKYQKNLMFCRKRAAPLAAKAAAHAQAAEEGAQRAAAGTAISTAGNIVANQPGAAAGAAAGDYQLVIDSCLIKRGYRFLR